MFSLYNENINIFGISCNVSGEYAIMRINKEEVFMDIETKSVETTSPDAAGSPKRTTRKKPVIAEKTPYASITDFCNYYGLRYTSVQYHLRQGKTGDEILSILRGRSVTRRYNKAPGRAVSVQIGDETFQSISEAAMAYGVSTDEVEKAMMDGTATPAFSNMALPEDPDQAIRISKECIVAGVPYPSMAAAARAYGIPMVTVRSRMAREGISFEEALRRGHMERHRIIAEKSKWPGINLEPLEGEVEEKTAKELFSILEQNNYGPKVFWDKEAGATAIKIQESLEAISRPLDIYIVFDESDLSKDIEFIMPEIGKQKYLSDTKQVLLYQQINEMNERYIGSKISLRDRFFSARWSLTQASRSIQATAFMRCFYRFIGSTAGIWRELKWAEQEVVPVM